MVYYSAGLEVPDPVVVHQIRTLFYHFDVQEKMVRSILDFVEMMGGKAAKVQNSLDDLLKERVDAERLYVEQDYTLCREKMSQMVEEIASLDEAAVRAKNAAFLWVYLTEWSTVTATSILSGYLLYLAMIRRRFYREVASTRID